MGELHWLKVQVGLFDTAKFKYMFQQPNGDAYVITLFRLKDLAAQINDHGKIYLSSKKEMNIKILAANLGRRTKFVEKALALYEELDLISRDENGIIQISTWNTDQGQDKIDRVREQTRNRVAAYRERQKAADQDDSLPDEEISPSEEAAMAEQPPLSLDTASAKHYEACFGQVSPTIAMKLAEFEQDWGAKAVCRCIDIAQDKGISKINYIRGILRSGGGDEPKEDWTYHDRSKEIYEYVDDLLRRAEEQEALSQSSDDYQAGIA